MVAPSMSPADLDALREGLIVPLARDLAREGGWQDPDAPWTENQVIIARGGAGEPVYREYLDDARSLLGREALSDLIAKAGRVEAAEAERDEARETNRGLHRRAQKAERFRARYGGSIKGVVSRVVKERRACAAALARATAAEADNALLLEVIGMALAETAFAVADEREGIATEQTRRIRFAGIRDALHGVGSIKHRTALAADKPDSTEAPASAAASTQERARRGLR